MSFLQRLREQQKANQNVQPEPLPAVSSEGESVSGAAPVSASIPIEGTAAAPAEGTTQPTKVTGLSFLTRRPAASPNPVQEAVRGDSEVSAEASLGLDVSGDEGESVGEASPSAEGHGDAPVPAAGLVDSESTVNDGPDSAELFRARLDALDALCQSESGITPLIHDQVKSHVREIMIDLKTNPEMRGLLLDDDMHNIMLFVQSSTQVQQAKIEKVATKRMKKTASAIAASAFDAGFDSLDEVPTLESLGAKNTDSVTTKVR